MFSQINTVVLPPLCQCEILQKIYFLRAIPIPLGVDFINKCMSAKYFRHVSYALNCKKNLPMPNKLGAHKHTLRKHVSKIEWRFLANTHELGTFLLALQSFVKLTLCSKISIKNN